MDTLQDRLRQLMTDRGISAAEVARMANVSRASVSQWLSGSIKSLNAETAVDLARALGVDDALWLATGQRSGPGTGEAGRLQAPITQNPDEIVISEYDAAGAMGNGLELRDQPGVIHSWRVSREWLHKNVRHYSNADSLAIVTGFGDSMRPMFNPGDPLLVDVGINSVEFDAVYFFRVGSEGFIKRLQRIPTEAGNILRAKSENKEYDSWDITPKMDFQVFGRVLKVWRSEEF